ncbi:MAG: carbohydrate-binding protein [Paludibacteraceae bacterium]|nr:carbohydrate-binding protein [Paludibacteraceae bacterium]
MNILYKSALVTALGAMFSVTVAAQSLPGVKSTINVNGKNRTIDVYAPSGMGENRPMVISAHGMGQDIAYQKQQSRWDQVADTAKFLVVYPQSDGSTWDLGASGADIAFIKAIIKEMSSKYKIDLKRVYMSGFSMGGMLTYSVANNMADQIAACAPVSGYPIGDMTAKPSRPIPIIHTNGDADDVVHYEPWKGTFNGMYQEQQGAYAQASAWAKANGCEDTPVESVVDGAATRYLWKNGKCGVEVCLNKIYGKGHWPSNDKYHSVREIWRFLRRFSLDCGSSSIEPGAEPGNPVSEAGPYNGTPASIPGKIEAEEYDFGGQGVAYSDEDSENRGEAFRNDGVDIYAAATGYSIGYNQEGEWVNYTVDVKETSKYTVSISAATDNASASFQLLIDGKAVTGDISAPNTGGFKDYRNVIARTKEISAGQHTLQLKVTGSWFDIDYMTFEKYESNGSDPYDENGCVIGNRDDVELASVFSSISLSNVNPKVKPAPNHNPIMTQRYGADPCAMVYGDSVYIYMTHDIYEYKNGSIKSNEYGTITEIVCLSSADLVNWTDHGPMKVAGQGGISKAGNSWAPTACHAKINGKDRFFLYFANGGNGIYVVAGDTPYGPWEDVKQGQGLITRSMPNCNVEWLFDPAVLVDDDGTGYIYFGGGVPQGRNADPGTARIAKLDKDFINIVGSAQSLNPPYLFEDAGINKIGNNYVYSYCTNWNTNGNNYGISNAVIATMISTNPMNNFKFDRKVFDNPSKWLGDNGNNHHSFFKFKDKWYITYHSQWLQNQIGVSGGYRSSHVDYANVDESAGKILGVDAGTTKGVSQVVPVDGTKNIQAECFAWQSGIEVNYVGRSTNMAVKGKSGSWIGLAGVQAKGVNKFKAHVSAPCGGAIRISTGSANGPVLGYLNVESNSSFEEFTCDLTSDIPTATDLYFTFSGELEFDTWNMFYEELSGNEEIEDATATLTVLPNPAKDVVTISGLNNGDVVTITSATGVTAKTFVAGADAVEVVVSDFVAGVYFISNGVKTVRMIKY